MAFRHLAALLALALSFFAGAASALADDSARNKEGFWTVGRGSADSKSCMASIMTDSGAMLLVQVEPGHVDVVVSTGKTQRAGKAGAISIDAESFDFQPAYSDNRDFMFFQDADARVAAALRQARNVAVRVDGRDLIDVSVENTGVEGALEAVTACSRGESGWWGPGVGAKRALPPMNKEQSWYLTPSDEDGICTAYALAGDHTLLVLLGDQGEIGVAVKTHDAMRRGRKGLVEADSIAIAFKPIFDGSTYFAADQSFDAAALAALRNAKALRVSLDGRAVADVALEGTGLPALLDDLAACSKGQKGWWGDGVKAP